MKAYARLLSDAVSDYRRIIRELGGQTVAPATSSTGGGAAFGLSPAWANATSGWLLASTPAIPAALPTAPPAAFACPGSPPISRLCGNASALALDGDADTVLLVRAANSSALRGPRGPAGVAAAAASFLLDLGSCVSVSGLRATVRLSAGGSGGTGVSAALRPVILSLYALSDPSATGWREATRGPLRVAFEGGAGATSFSANFEAYAARYWAVVVSPAAPAEGDAASVVLRVPDLSLRVAGVADASVPCQSDELVPFNDAEPTVPKVRWGRGLARVEVHPPCILLRACRCACSCASPPARATRRSSES